MKVYVVFLLLAVIASVLNAKSLGSDFDLEDMSAEDTSKRLIEFKRMIEFKRDLESELDAINRYQDELLQLSKQQRPHHGSFRQSMRKRPAMGIGARST